MVRALPLLLLALCCRAGCGAAGARLVDEEYGAVGMPHYDDDDYEGPEPAPKRGAGGAGGAWDTGNAGDAGDAYPEQDAHSLDLYLYDEEQPRGRNDISYMKQGKESNKRNKNKKNKKATANLYIDFESNKYNNDDTFDKFTPDYKKEYYSESGNKGRNKKRRSGVNELSQRTSPKFSRKRAEDPDEQHPDAQDSDEPESRQHHLLDSEDDESQYSNKMTTRRKNRRIPRDKAQTSPKSPADTGENSEHRQRPARTDVRRREKDRRNIRGREEDVEGEKGATSRAAKISKHGKRQLHEEPGDFINEDIRLDEIARGPQDVGAEKEVAPPTRAGQEQPGGDYEDYKIDVESLARRRAMLERVLGGRPTTELADDMDATPEIPVEPPSPPPPTPTALSKTTTEASTTAPPELSTAGELVTRTSGATGAAPAIVTDITPTLRVQATDELPELSIAEKSRLSILKKSQKKDSLRDSIMTKPAVLRQVVTATAVPGGRRAMAGGMVSTAGSTTQFALLEPQEEAYSPELLSRVKSIMRQRLVSRARSLRELTDDWDAVVCEYVDDALVLALGTPLASRTPRASAPAALLFCAALLVSAAC